MLTKKMYKSIFLIFFGIIFLTSCESLLPDDLDTFDADTRFTQIVYQPLLGRDMLMDNNFNPANSSRPFTMKILNLKRSDGSEATELMEKFPVKVWTKAYLGNESTLEEIKNKRAIEYWPLFSIREHSGAFIMRAKANSSFIKVAPDTGYTFDVEVSNSGGSKIFYDFKLMPQRERPYEPSNYDPDTGIAQNTFVNPLSVNNLKGKTSGFEIPQSSVEITFVKNEDVVEGDKTLTFRFLDSNYMPINPDKFNRTDWSKLIHGFNMEKTNEFVRYKVAYPIPLISLVTPYTNTSGEKAHVEFAYDRLNAGGLKEFSNILFDFSIYEEGNWEIIIKFSGETPKFEND